MRSPRLLRAGCAPSAFGIDDDDHRFTRELIEIERTQTAACPVNRELIALSASCFLKFTGVALGFCRRRECSRPMRCAAKTNAIRRRQRHVAGNTRPRGLAQEPRSPRLVQPD